MKLSAFCIKSFLLVGAVILFSCDYIATSDAGLISSLEQLRRNILELDQALIFAANRNNSLSDVGEIGARKLVVAIKMQQNFIKKKTAWHFGWPSCHSGS